MPGRITASIACATLGVLALAGPAAAAAPKVGVAAAVNPDAFHVPPGGSTETLVIGKSILHNERISTSQSGVVQVLFIDGSTITVGPNSNLVIDTFVYDPKKETGRLVASFTKGALRFVGGKVSKAEGGVTVKTPMGTLGVRGGMFQGVINGARQGQFSFLFGNNMTFQGNNGQTHNIFQPGYTLNFQGNNGTVGPTPRELVQFFLSQFSGRNQGGGGNNQPTDQQVQNTVGNGNSGNTERTPPSFNTLNLNTNENDRTTTDIIRQLVQNNQTTNNDPPQNDPPTNDPPLNDPPLNNPPINGNPPDDGGNLPDPPPVTQFFGFTAGAAQWLLQDNEFQGIRSLNVDDFILNFDDNFTSVAAAAKIHSGDNFVQSYLLALAGSNAIPELEGFDMVLDAERFLAFHAEGLSTVFNGQGNPYPDESVSVNAILISGAYLDLLLQQLLQQEEIEFPNDVPELEGDKPFTQAVFGNSNAFCNQCDFLKWGLLAAEVQVGEGENGAIDDVLAAWWIAGDVTNNADLPAAGNATYSGTALGMASSPAGAHIATGQLDMDWNFASRMGRLDITRYDQGQYNFGGPMTAPGNLNQFTGPLSGDLTGAATGAFVNGPNGPAQGVIGNFEANNGNYYTTGVFGAGQTSFTPPGPQ